VSFLPKIQVRKPKVKVKKIYMKEIKKNLTKETIWMKKDIAKNSDKLFSSFDIDELCEKFQTVQKVEKVVVEVKEVKEEKKFKTFLDGNRGGTMLRQRQALRGLDNDTLIKSILELDEKKINEENVVTVLSICPQEEEINGILEMVDQEGDFGEAEKICLLFKDIPRAYQRIESWKAKMQFENDIFSIRPSVDAANFGVS
jgi:hypothetical protein